MLALEWVYLQMASCVQAWLTIWVKLPSLSSVTCLNKPLRVGDMQNAKCKKLTRLG